MDDCQQRYHGVRVRKCWYEGREGREGTEGTEGRGGLWMKRLNCCLRPIIEIARNGRQGIWVRSAQVCKATR